LSSIRDWAPLVLAVAERQDREAFALIFDFFTPRLEAYLMRLGLGASEAEEITQDVMVTLWRKAGLFDPQKSGLSTWLYRIARNRRIDLSRRSRTESIDPQSPAILALADPAQTDQALEYRQRDDRVRASIETLALEQRQLVMLAFYEGLSHQQIADRTKIPLGTVKSRLRNAFSRLRGVLEAGGIPDAQ
jgi:RNA polymerase sigma factor (sigma-70 family)